MCLSLITESYPGKGIGPIIAFKKFKVIDGKVRHFCQSGGDWKVGKEQSAGPKTVTIKNRWKKFEYPAGFHAYQRKKPNGWLGEHGAWAKVRLRGVQTKGKQGGKTVFVARYCKILEILGK